jgi:phosphohistidine phosphatase SixA
MRTLPAGIMILILAVSCSFGQEKITTFILVRHAEKVSDGTKDPDLSPAGARRATALAQLLSKTSIDAIYSTDFVRTRNTIAPVAAEKKLDVKLYEAFKVEEVEKMLKTHAGTTILICGHSNNIPWIANLLIGKEQFRQYQENEYENLLIVSVVEKGKIAKVTRLSF